MSGDEATRLDETHVVEAARARAELQDFGDEAFREPMRLLLDSLDREADLNAGGRMAQRARVEDILVNRLRAEDHFRRSPEILEQQLAPPIVIVGLSRTGTTMLQRLLASDPDAYAVLWWENRNPAPLPGHVWGGHDARIDDAVEQVRLILEAAPQLASIHPWDPEGPDEEILLLEHSFYSTTPESMANVPSYRAWLRTRDQTPGYRYLERLLQLLQWQKRRAGSEAARWVLKTPHHLGYLDVLFRVFPETRVIQTHRDPLETIPSVASMYHALWSLACDDPDPLEVGRQCAEHYAQALARCLEVRDAMGPERFVDVDYRAVVRDPLQEVRRIYEQLGSSLTSAAEAAMTEWIRTHARDTRPAHDYTLEKFGYSERGIARDFAAYRERFILPGSRS